MKDWFRHILREMPNVTPEFLKIQEGRGVNEVFAEMMHDPHIQSVFRTRRMEVAARSWSIKPADDSKKGITIAEFTRKTLQAIPNFEHALAHLLKAVPYGFSVAEIMWRIDDDGVRIEALRTRRYERFAYEQDRLKLIDSETSDLKALPNRKFVDHKHTPYGYPLLYSLYWLWYFKKHAQEMFNAYRYVFPSAPTVFTDTQIRKFIDTLFHWKGLDVGDEILEERIEGENQGFFRDLLDFCNGVISERVLGDVPELKTKGSYKEARERIEVELDILCGDIDQLEGTIQETLIRWLIDFNYGIDMAAPTFSINHPVRCMMDTPEFAQTLKTLSDMGYKVPERFIAETFGLPKEED